MQQQQEIAIEETQLASKEQVLQQTIVKFKKFMIEELQIGEEKLNTNEGLQEKLTVINKFKSVINLLGREQVSNYISGVISNHFNLSDISKQNKKKMGDFIDLLIELCMD